MNSNHFLRILIGLANILHFSVQAAFYAVKKVNKFLFISAQSKTSVRKLAQSSEMDVLDSLSDKNMVDILFLHRLYAQSVRPQIYTTYAQGRQRLKSSHRIDDSSIVICIIRYPSLFFNNIVITAEIFVLKSKISIHGSAP